MYFKIIIIYICVLLEAVLVQAHAQTDSVETDTLPVPWRQIVVEKLQRLTDNDITAKSQLGLMVFDLDADSALFCHNHLQTMRPASTMKLVTAIAALDRLGGSYRFSTDGGRHHHGKCICRQKHEGHCDARRRMVLGRRQSLSVAVAYLEKE